MFPLIRQKDLLRLPVPLVSIVVDNGVSQERLQLLGRNGSAPECLVDIFRGRLVAFTQDKQLLNHLFHGNSCWETKGFSDKCSYTTFAKADDACNTIDERFVLS